MHVGHDIATITGYLNYREQDAYHDTFNGRKNYFTWRAEEKRAFEFCGLHGDIPEIGAMDKTPLRALSRISKTCVGALGYL